jgi:hypothetical protein
MYIHFIVAQVLDGVNQLRIHSRSRSIIIIIWILLEPPRPNTNSTQEPSDHAIQQDTGNPAEVEAADDVAAAFETENNHGWLSFVHTFGKEEL